jgi:hypothetical protein
MSTSKQTMELALDALIDLVSEKIGYMTVNSLGDPTKEPTYIIGSNAITALKEVIKAQGEHQAEIVADENGYLTTQWAIDYIPNVGDKLYTSAPTIPAGMVLVPIEPTPEMMQQLRWEAKRAAAPKGENE